MKYIPTDNNVLDIFTKALPKLKFKQMVKLLGLRRLKRARRIQYRQVWLTVEVSSYQIRMSMVVKVVQDASSSGCDGQCEV